MTQTSKFSKFNLIFKSILLFLSILLFFRMSFYFLFSPNSLPTNYILKSLYLGFKFDLRVSALIGGILFVLSFLPKNRLTQCILIVTQFLFGIGIIGLYYADFGNYSYLAQRLNISFFSLGENPWISLEMVYQTYPVFKGAFDLPPLTSPVVMS